MRKKVSEKEHFDMAQQYMEQHNYEKAVEYFQKVYNDYPNGLLSSKALFMTGFINANYLQDFEKARESYSLFIEKYPDHELAKDAKFELDLMGKSPDELPFMKELEDQTGADSTGQSGGAAQ
ncbi:MAG: tetratricopeptide repeat protein [Calditrichae bacterium]|nr:tetratricopeptide repeat protein [Calditrichia bacterium]